MDQGENQLHSFGIFNRLLNSLRKSFREISLKLMIFGCLFTRGLEICHWLFDVIILNLASHAMKPVTLGPPAHNDPSQDKSSEVHIESEELSVIGVPTPLPSLSLNFRDYMTDGQELQPTQDEDRTEGLVPEFEIKTQRKGPPKKMVSINDTAEVLTYPSKEKKRKKATEKSASLDREKGEEPKPLKSILKVGSNLKG